MIQIGPCKVMNLQLKRAKTLSCLGENKTSIYMDEVCTRALLKLKSIEVTVHVALQSYISTGTHSC